MDELRANRETSLAALAGRQHGIVSTDQLRGLGLSKDAAFKRVRSGRLHRVFRGVYAVGHAGLSNEGRWMAATLACGEGAVLSHRSAAEHLGLLEPSPGDVDVTVPGNGGRAKRQGLRVHRSALPSSSWVWRDRIAVTTPARTLADLRRCGGAEAFRRAVRQAEFLGYDTGLETDHTRSEPEAAFLRLCRRHRIPPPETNVGVGRYTVDFLWRREGLVVEVDGYAAHRGRHAFEDDRQRELDLAQAGLRLRRFSALQVVAQARRVVLAVRAELHERAP